MKKLFALAAVAALAGAPAFADGGFAIGGGQSHGGSNAISGSMSGSTTGWGGNGYNDTTAYGGAFQSSQGTANAGAAVTHFHFGPVEIVNVETQHADSAQTDSATYGGSTNYSGGFFGPHGGGAGGGVAWGNSQSSSAVIGGFLNID